MSINESVTEFSKVPPPYFPTPTSGAVRVRGEGSGGGGTDSDT